MSFLPVSLLLTVLSILSVCQASCLSSCLVELPFGKIQGKCVNGMCWYSNIPYALPPIGEHRFAEPFAYNINWSGIRDATKASTSCVQFSPNHDWTVGSEDCLFVHIFTPGSGGNHPVRIYIHGGSFMSGSPSDTDPTMLVKNNMIVVTFGYRLGPLGFLSNGNECIPGNNGLKDQRLALRWIKQYIHNFNGLSNKILLSGSDAGGAAAHLHMMNKESENLFNGVMANNGLALMPWVFQAKPAKIYSNFALQLNCPLLCPQAKTCLRAKSVKEIVDAVKKQYTFLNIPFNIYGPVVEAANAGAFLSKTPESIIKSGKAANVTLLIAYAEREGSYTAAEWLYIGPDGNTRIPILNEKWSDYGPIMLFYNDTMSTSARDQFSIELKEKYFGKRVFRKENYCQLENMFTDILYMDGIKKTICLHRKYACGKLFLYKYNYPHTFGMGNILSQRSDIAFGADHGSDGLFSLSLKTLKPSKLAPNEQRIALRLIELQKALANGNAVYGGISLPLNSPSKSGKLIIKKNCHELEYCQASDCDECVQM